jgi:hypothetical protein
VSFLSQIRSAKASPERLRQNYGNVEGVWPGPQPQKQLRASVRFYLAPPRASTSLCDVIASGVWRAHTESDPAVAGTVLQSTGRNPGDRSGLAQSAITPAASARTTGRRTMHPQSPKAIPSGLSAASDQRPPKEVMVPSGELAVGRKFLGNSFCGEDGVDVDLHGVLDAAGVTPG